MAEGRRPTIKDVAAHAGVSKSTVSLVLQNSKLVRKETRAAVEASMKALNYVRNRAAATLRGSGTGLIGLVINDLRNPFFTEFAASAQMAFHQRGYATVIANCDEDAEIQNRTILSMLEHDVAALMISPCHGDVAAGFAAIERAGLPALQVLRRVETGAPPLPFFSHDYAAGGRAATRHLLDQGARRIAFVGGVEGRPVTAERQAGYRAEMAARGLAPLILPGRATRAFGRAAAATIAGAEGGIEAALCFNDLVALGMMAGLAEAGRLPGRDILLVGFDDIEEARLAYPPLSSVDCDVPRFGRQGAATLLRWMEAGAAPRAEERLPVTLRIRASSRREAAGG